MHPELEQLRVLLEARYERHIGTVAFVDESYRERSEMGKPPFYTVTATVIHSDDLDSFREDYIRVARGNWWHTTDIFNKGDEDSIFAFIRQILTHETTSLIAVQTQVVNNDIELARRECLIQLCSTLWSINCKLAVYERREDTKSRNADVSLFSQAMSSGYLSRNLKTFAGHPRVEPLLWGPDLVGWALRRHLAIGDDRWIKPLLGNVELYNASQFSDRLKEKKPKPAAAMGFGSGFSVDHEGEERNRSSQQSMASIAHFNQDIPAIFPRISPVLHDPEKLREWLKLVFPKPMNAKRPRHF
jgi:hypothetical protein